MLATEEVIRGNSGTAFVLIEDFDPLYEDFTLRARELAPELMTIRLRMREHLAAAVGPLTTLKLASIHHLDLPLQPDLDFTVTLEGGVLFPRSDYRIEITRACRDLRQALRGPYMRLSRQFAPLLNQQILTLRESFERSTKQSIVLLDDGIGTGRTFKRIIDLCRDLALPVSAVIAITNPDELQEIAGVEVRTLNRSLGQAAWLNERDLFWGLPRSGMSISETDRFRAVGGVPYTINEEMVIARIGVPLSEARSFTEGALLCNQRFFELHEEALLREVVFSEIPRLSCLYDRKAVALPRISHCLANLAEDESARARTLDAVL